MKQIEELIRKAFHDSGLTAPDAIVVTRPNEKFGDFATSVVLSSAISHEHVSKIVENLISPFISDVEVSGSGFINIRMSDAWLEGCLKKDSPFLPILKGRRYIIEYSSPNIAKPMHIGHLRTTVLGQVLVNLFRKVGAEVVAWSHPGDWGVQFGKLIVAWKKWGNEEDLKKQPIDELLRIYVKFHQEAHDHPELDDEAKAMFKALQDGNAESYALWKRFSELSQQEFDRMYKLLGVSFDVWRGESAYNDQLQDLVDRALASGVAKTSEGAIIILLEAESLPPVLIRKSDGATLYATSDLVSVGERVKEYHPDEMVYVVGNEQSLHLSQVFAAATKLAEAGVYGEDLQMPKLYHVSYGFFRLVSGKMSTRKGEVIRLDDVVNEAIAQADTMLKEKSPDLSDEERAKLAQTIGVGAVKYTDLLHDRHTDVVFDWDKMFALDGNSIVYLLYTNARCNSLLQGSEASHLTPPLSSEERVADRSGEVNTEWTPQEKRLLLTLLELSDATEKSIRDYDPHHLLNHAYKVASDFSRFYNADPILKSADKVRERRLQLVRRVQAQLKIVFDLLAVEAPEKL